MSDEDDVALKATSVGTIHQRHGSVGENLDESAVVDEITSADGLTPSSTRKRIVENPPQMGQMLGVMIVCDVVIILYLLIRAIWISKDKPDCYSFTCGPRTLLAMITIFMTAVILLGISLWAKEIFKPWVARVRFTQSAIDYGAEDDDIFLHLCVMSYITVMIFAVVGPVQFVVSVWMYFGDDLLRVNPPAFNDDVTDRILVELACTNGEIFTGYIMYEFGVWFLNWEGYSKVSLIHHGMFLTMGFLIRGVESLPLIGAASVAMEISSPALVIHMITRQLHGWQDVSEKAFTIFAPLFIVSRLIGYTTCIILTFRLYFFYFDLVSPRIFIGGLFHVIVWISFCGLVLQWGWSPQLFKKMLRTVKRKNKAARKADDDVSEI